MTHVPEKALDIAIQAVKVAGKIQVKHFGQIKNVKSKTEKPLDIVTNVDHEVDAAVQNIILKQFPEHGIVSEESPEKEGKYCCNDW